MPIAWDAKIWLDFCLQEDEEKEIEPILTDTAQKMKFPTEDLFSKCGFIFVRYE